MATPHPRAAVADTGGYPDWNKVCVVGNPNDSNSSFGKVTGPDGTEWCDDYQWGYFTYNDQGRITGNVQNSSRRYGYRNCTDWVAWRAQNAGVGTVPSGWSHAKYWDDANKAGAAGFAVDTTPEPGDIAVWNNGTYGHVAFVESVNTNGSVNVSEYNKQQDGNYGTRSNQTADSYIDLNGAGRGLNNAPWPPGSGGGSTPPQLHLNFFHLNDARGNLWVDAYSESSNYTQLTRGNATGYPSVPANGNVMPLIQPDGDLSLVNLNHPSGHAHVDTYSKASGYTQLIENEDTGYPAVPGDGAVIPLYQYDGDLSFIRLNHPNGPEIVAYSQRSAYKSLTEISDTAYPPVETDGSVVPLYWLNDDLVFLRLNHYSGKVELISYSKSSSYQQEANRQLVNYPAIALPGVAPDKAVIPMFQPNDGDLSFVRLNHYTGKVEVITYAVGTGFQQMNDYDLSNYPAVPGDGSVVARYGS